MGSVLAPIMAEFAMNMIENKIKMPKMYIRYVDDVLAILDSEEEAHDLLNSLNSFHTDLKFTIEKMENSSIKFLDMLITQTESGLKTSWTLKPTNTGLYTPKSSIIHSQCVQLSHCLNVMKLLQHTLKTRM